MFTLPLTGSSVAATVTATKANMGGMVADKVYLFSSSTNCWIKQGTTYLVTCTTNANMTDGDTLTIAVVGKTSVTYEYDKAANGVASGNTSWAAGAATAIDVAATLVTALAAAQSYLTVTNNGDGTVLITMADTQMAITENVANAAFTVAASAPPVTAASGSMYVPANAQVTVSGNRGAQIGVLRDSVDGKASLTKVYTAPY